MASADAYGKALLTAKGLTVATVFCHPIHARCVPIGYTRTQSETVAALLTETRSNAGRHAVSMAGRWRWVHSIRPFGTASAQSLSMSCDALDGKRRASDLLLPRVDLGALYPEPAARLVGRAVAKFELAAACWTSIARIRHSGCDR